MIALLIHMFTLLKHLWKRGRKRIHFPKKGVGKVNEEVTDWLLALNELGVKSNFIGCRFSHRLLLVKIVVFGRLSKSIERIKKYCAFHAIANK